MKNDKYNIYIIKMAVEGYYMVPVHAFISYTHDNAKATFYEYTKNSTFNYELQQIGEYKNRKFKEKQITIIAMDYKIEQINLFKEKEIIKKAAKKDTTAEIIKELFEGTTIE